MKKKVAVVLIVVLCSLVASIAFAAIRCPECGSSVKFVKHGEFDYDDDGDFFQLDYYRCEKGHIVTLRNYKPF